MPHEGDNDQANCQSHEPQGHYRTLCRCTCDRFARTTPRLRWKTSLPRSPMDCVTHSGFYTVEGRKGRAANICLHVCLQRVIRRAQCVPDHSLCACVAGTPSPSERIMGTSLSGSVSHQNFKLSLIYAVTAPVYARLLWPQMMRQAGVRRETYAPAP